MAKLKIKSIIDKILSPVKPAYIVIDFYDDDGKLIKQQNRAHYVLGIKLIGPDVSIGTLFLAKNLDNTRNFSNLPIYTNDKPVRPNIKEYIMIASILKHNNIYFNKKKGVFVRYGEEIDNNLFL